MLPVIIGSSNDPIEMTSWGPPPPARIEEEEFDIVAFELWQRGSSSAIEEEACLDAEENILAPH